MVQRLQGTKINTKGYDAWIKLAKNLEQVHVAKDTKQSSKYSTKLSNKSIRKCIQTLNKEACKEWTNDKDLRQEKN